MESFLIIDGIAFWIFWIVLIIAVIAFIAVGCSYIAVNQELAEAKDENRALRRKNTELECRLYKARFKLPEDE